MKYLSLATITLCSSICVASSMGNTLLETFNQQGLEAATNLYHEEMANSSSALDMREIRSLVQNLIEADKLDAARTFLHLNRLAFPDSVQVYSDLALFTFNIGERDSSRIYITQAAELDPFLLSTVILKKRIYFVPDDFSHPQRLETDNFFIRPIRGSDAEMDYPAVMSSISHIKEIMGSRSWPSEELTLEEDRNDLARHEGEMERGEAFVYTVMNRSQTSILGCIYIFTSRLDQLDAEIAFWTTQEAYEEGLDSILFEDIQSWIEQDWPFEEVVYPGRSMSFQEFYTALGEQDEKYH